MEDQNEQQKIRLEKLDQLREQGVNPYPYRFAFTHRATELLANGETLLETGEEVALAGRLMTARGQGKASFAHVKDNHVRIQVYVRTDEVGEEAYEMFRHFDLGDYLGLNGVMMRTKTGELTLRVKSLVLLAKSIRPLPIAKVEERDGEKVVHDQVKDTEFRYRQRYVDLVVNDDVAQVFLQRTQIIQTIRSYLIDHSYLEVETPNLQVIYGGAAASPFVTHHKALDIPLYLRIATELYLKRLVVGGFDRVFEIGKNFRNEGVDRTHNPEFTMVEFYQAYADYGDMMEHFEAIWEKCAHVLHGSTQFEYQGTTLDVKRPWKRYTVKGALKELAEVDVDALDDGALQALLKKHDITVEGAFNRGLTTMALFEELCEEKLVQPTFITDYPKESTPLCKEHRDDPSLVERFEPYMAGYEIGNAYSELNDPLIQRQLLEEQAGLRAKGDAEAHPFDADFIRSMEYGMPPMGGIGMGVDRMVMLLTNQYSIRDVLFFPTMKLEKSDQG